VKLYLSLEYGTLTAPQLLEDTGLGGKGGGNTERALKNGFGVIPDFLEIANVGEAYLIFVRISVLLKVYSTNRPNRLETFMCFAKKNT